MAAPKKKQGPLINMERNNIDPNYRYKFEKVCIKTEGKRKKTIITNLLEIADGILGTRMSVNDDDKQHAERYSTDIVIKTAKHMIQFIQRKLNAQCRFHKARKVAIISGVYSQDKLQQVVFDYVDHHCICPRCDYPELTPAIQLTIVCKACGFSKTQHAKGTKQKIKSKKRKKKKDIVYNEVEPPKISKDPISVLKSYLNENSALSIEDIVEKIKVLRIAHNLQRTEEIQMVVYVLVQYEEDDYKLLMHSLKKYKNIFLMYTMQQTDTQIFISYVEEMITRRSKGDNLLNHSYHIFNGLYDEDILDEDEIKEWYHDHVSPNKYRIVSPHELQAIKQNTARFIKWLETAENDDTD